LISASQEDIRQLDVMLLALEVRNDSRMIKKLE
jgi:hypothetical protein